MSTVLDEVARDGRRALFEDRCAQIADRFQAFRASQTQFAEFSSNLFDRLEVISRDLADRETAVVTQVADQQAEQAAAELSAVHAQLGKQDAELIKLRSELEAERERAGREKISLDEETREFLDDLVQERDSLLARLQEAQSQASEQYSGYESELELLRTQLDEANRQIAKFRGHANSPTEVVDDGSSQESSAPPASQQEATEDLSGQMPENRNRDLRNSAGVELESLMSQVRMLQKDVARRRNQRGSK